MTADVSWSDSTLFSCPCGELYPVAYWRWIDVTARPDLADTVLTQGPFEGACPVCGRTARAAGTWLRLDPAAQRATLVMSRARRGAVVVELREHLDVLLRRPQAVQHWMLQPTLEFVELAPPEAPRGKRVIESVSSSAHSGELVLDLPPAGRTTRRRPTDDADLAGVPQLISSERRSASPPEIPSGLGALLGELELAASGVRVVVALPSERRDPWEKASLEARPIVLRGRGYPLLGVHIIGSFMGQRGCIDAMVDAAEADAQDIFSALSAEFRLGLNTRAGSNEFEREIHQSGLEPNARLCLQAASGLLARGQYPPENFRRAVARLAEESVSRRLAPSPVSLSKGAYPFILGADEAVRALELLDRASRKEHFTRLLEVDGFPVVEYEGLRHRILAGALEFGLVAPRRFWKRVIALGLATDLHDYATKLAKARAEHAGEEGDLEPEAAREAWEGILELCERKDIPPPPELRAALSLESAEQGHQRVAQRQDGQEDDLKAQLRDPDVRLKVAADIVQGRVVAAVDLVFEAMDYFGVDELLALLPDLSELGPRVVPRLLPKLQSERRELRQSAAILLGMATDARALDPLAACMVQETTSAWQDMARAVGAFGEVALPSLCNTLRRMNEGVEEADVVDRVARAFVEVAVTERQDPARGDAMVETLESLAESSDPRIVAAAERAVGTLREMHASGSSGAETPMESRGDEARGFAQRAYEAIMVPEVEVEAEA